jgi:hypothetical protein
MRKSLALKIDISTTLLHPIGVLILISAVTDIAGEMATIAQELPRGCKECHKACTAAVEMLAVSPFPETLASHSLIQICTV